MAGSIIHFHMLFLDGVYVGEASSSSRFRWVTEPTSYKLAQLTHTIARRLARHLERRGLLVRDAEHSFLALDNSNEENAGVLGVKKEKICFHRLIANFQRRGYTRTPGTINRSPVSRPCHTSHVHNQRADSLPASRSGGRQQSPAGIHRKRSL